MVAPHLSNITPDSHDAAHSPRFQSGVVPRPVLKLDLLTFHLLNPRDPGPADLPLLGEAYQCWSQVWRQTFEELDKVRHLPSDDFTRQDEIAGLFQEWECIATAAIRWLDLQNPIYRDDSYFSVWPRTAIDAAAAHGPRICIVSSFAVSVPWRRARGGRVRDLFGALLLNRFLDSEADSLLATVRNDHGMNSLCYSLGFVPLARNATHHGVPVDLVAFHRSTCTRPSIPRAVEHLANALPLAGNAL